MLRDAMDDVRAELQAAEDEARQQAASLRQRARRLRLRGFGNLADELEAHAVALHETADSIVTQLQEWPPPSAEAWREPSGRCARYHRVGVTWEVSSTSPTPTV